MTFEEVQKGGILSAEERSHDFATLGIDLDEKAIGKLPKKVSSAIIEWESKG